MKKKFIQTLFVAFCCFHFSDAIAQNVSINILTLNSGLVAVGSTVFVQIDITNTDGTLSVPAYKIRPFLSTPIALVSIPASGHTLPSGWTITSNTNGVIRFSNGADVIPPNTSRTLLIALKGTILGGPSTVSGSLLFSNGISPGTTSGPALSGDNTADNTSTSTVEVSTITPVKLTNFNAQLVNCKPALNWNTEIEANSDKFEIERANSTATDWAMVGSITASGYSYGKLKYSFNDNTLALTSGKILYRLKIFDKDGKYNYSPVLPVFINCKTAQVNTYPNPVQHGLLNVNVVTVNNENTDAVLIGTSGQVVLKMNLKNGLNTVNVSTIANGEYVLKVNATNTVNKVLIQNKK
jgi:hypothetical protein